MNKDLLNVTNQSRTNPLVKTRKLMTQSVKPAGAWAN